MCVCVCACMYFHVLFSSLDRVVLSRQASSQDLVRLHLEHLLSLALTQNEEETNVKVCQYSITKPTP